MAKKKVAFVFGGLPHYYNFILNKINKLSEYEVVVIYPSHEDGKSLGKGVQQTKDGIEFGLYEFPEVKGLAGKPFFKNFKKALTEIKPDILVIGFPYVLQIYARPFLAAFIRRNNIRVIEKTIPFQIPKFGDAFAYFKNPDNFLDESLKPTYKVSWISNIRYFLLTRFRKFYYKKVDAFVCYIEEAFEILGSYGVPKEKIFISYNSPDTEPFFEVAKRILQMPAILPAKKHRIIHVGRLVKWKKTHFLIQILPDLLRNFPDLELVILGDGPEKENLEAQAAALGVSQHVVFVGKIYKPEDLGRYLHESSLYVLAGMGGLSINDAMCFAKPIICSICDGTEKKLVRNGVNGFIFEDNNTEDLKDKITQILANPALMESMGKNSLEIIKNEINEKVVVEAYRKSFDFVLKNKHTS